MSELQAFFLGIFQGITEFLPISSSGHLVLAEHYFSLPTEELLVFDAVLHGGSLLSLMVVFWKDILGFFRVIFFPKSAPEKDKKILLWLILATIPTIIFGFFLKESMDIFRTPKYVAFFFLISAGMFYLAEKFPKRKNKGIQQQTALFAAVFQIFALLPGISRSGIVMAGSMFAGTNREEATRFSFLLGLPVIAGAFLLSVASVLRSGLPESLSYPSLFIGFISSAISGFFMARFLLRFFKNHTLHGFAVYLVIISIIILVYSS